MMSFRPKPTAATYFGLFIALGVPLLIFPTRMLQRIGPICAWANEAVVWGLAAAVLCTLVFAERLPLSSIGLGRLTWKSVGWGILGAFAVRLGVVIVMVAYAAFTGASAMDAFRPDLKTIMTLGALPLPFLVMLALRAGITEEILFRGYAIERLGAVTGSRIFAGAVSLAVFTVAHLGVFESHYLIAVLPAGFVLTAQYLWRRDLWANMIAHFLTDGVGLGTAYAIAHHLVKLQGFG